MDAGRRNDGGMTDPSHGSKPLRVLLSEGSSTSAREAITALGLKGHIVEVCVLASPIVPRGILSNSSLETKGKML